MVDNPNEPQGGWQNLTPFRVSEVQFFKKGLAHA